MFKNLSFSEKMIILKLQAWIQQKNQACRMVKTMNGVTETEKTTITTNTAVTSLFTYSVHFIDYFLGKFALSKSTNKDMFIFSKEDKTIQLVKYFKDKKRLFLAEYCNCLEDLDLNYTLYIPNSAARLVKKLINSCNPIYLQITTTKNLTSIEYKNHKITFPIPNNVEEYRKDIEKLIDRCKKVVFITEIDKKEFITHQVWAIDPKKYHILEIRFSDYLIEISSEDLYIPIRFSSPCQLDISFKIPASWFVELIKILTFMSTISPIEFYIEEYTENPILVVTTRSIAFRYFFEAIMIVEA